MDSFVQDIRYAIRGLRRAPGFALVAVLTLAIGIGANTAIFSVVNAVLLRPLAYQEPEQLVALNGLVTVTSQGADQIGSSAPEFRNYRDDVPGIADVAAVWPININLTGQGTPERLQAAGVSFNYTTVLGVEPIVGRNFTPEDDAGRVGYVALISYELWQRRFGGASDVIGKVMQLDDDPIQIIGVMPRGFRHPMERGASPMELWAPVDMENADDNFIGRRAFRPFEVIARLEPGVSVAQVQSQLDVLGARLRADFPEDYPERTNWRAQVIPLATRVVGDVKPALVVLLGAVGFVLLISCANVANLMLTRATSRGREIAIRTAMGSSRGRIARQLLTESVLLSVIGGLLGLGLASWGTSALGRLSTLYLPRAHGIGIDGTVLGFTLLISVVTGVVFGLLPALQGSRANVQSVLKEGGRAASAGAGRARLRGGLVVAEVAIALVLVAGAGLLLRSFQQLVAVDPGFVPDRVLAAQVWLSWPNEPQRGRFFTPEQRRLFYSRVAESVERTPGVEAVALVNRLPLSGRATTRFILRDREFAPDAERTRADLRFVSASYFATMGIPVLAGEGLATITDTLQPNRLVINRTMAEKFWPGDNPVGKEVQIFGDQGPVVTIAGVVGDVRQISLEEPPTDQMYLEYSRFAGLQMAILARTQRDPGQMAATVVRAIHAAEPEQPVFGVQPMSQLVADSGAARRFSLLLLTLFASIALLLSAIGIYGVMAYSTAQRRQEIGIRMALGAVPRDVFNLVVGQGMRLVALGLIIGLGGAWALSKVLSGQLYGIGARDPLTFVTAALVLGTVAFAASYIPALRATKVDPLDSMRSE